MTVNQPLPIAALFLLPVLLLVCPPRKTEGAFCPPGGAETGGMRDELLLYVAPDKWPGEHLRPYVAYLDKRTGKARDWFFDGWLFLMYGGAPSGEAYIDGATNKEDWLHFLDLLWKPGRELRALDDCIEEVGRELNEPKEVYPVTIMIPYPSTRQKNFGDIDGDGISEDLSQSANRLKAVQWFVDETLRRWNGAPFPHLKLWGFYWMNESVNPGDEDIVRRTCEFIHQRGYGVQWIPWYVAPGYDKWRSLGFDFAVMQPNFAFIDPRGGRHLPDEDRLTSNANRARANGLGVEMELKGDETRSPESRWNLLQYLNHGADQLDGTMKGAARAWYQSYSSVRDLYESDLPQCNELYDDLYRFHKGSYEQRRVSQAEGCVCTVSPGSYAGGKLTDGVWVTQGEDMNRVLRIDSDQMRMRLDLGSDLLVDDVRLHLVGNEFPALVKVNTAASGASMRHAGESDGMPPLRSESTGGFVIVTFPARVARYVELELFAENRMPMSVDEIVVPPARNPLWGARYSCAGLLMAQSASALTDGFCRTGHVSWRGPGSATFQLPQPCCASRVRVHCVDSGTSLKATAAVNGRRFKLLGKGTDGARWLQADLGVTLVRDLSVMFDAPGNYACDEVQLLPAINLALGKPYGLDPPFPSSYPDNGGVLTDGVLTQPLLGDGKTIGWLNATPEITLDLGKVKRLDEVRVHVEGGGYAAINFPESMTVALSTNGDEWRRFGPRKPNLEVTAEATIGGSRLATGWLTLDAVPADARLVRLRLSGSGWIMVSEVEALSKGVNVARGTPYSLWPLPSSNAKYADNKGVLTDGAISTGEGWQGCAGWEAADPTITVDLQTPRSFAAVSVHVVGGGPDSVFFPEDVTFAISQEGKSWRELGAVTEHPVNGGQVLPGAMSLQLPAPVRARYVRAHLKRRGWVMMDEIEIYSEP